jgi:hypothetical protein
MTKQEVYQRYAALGVVAYIEHCIKMYREEHGTEPTMVSIGHLEWEEIMGNNLDDEMSVDGIVVIPNDKVRGVDVD